MSTTMARQLQKTLLEKGKNPMAMGSRTSLDGSFSAWKQYFRPFLNQIPPRLSCANALNLDWFDILLFGKELACESTSVVKLVYDSHVRLQVNMF